MLPTKAVLLIIPKLRKLVSKGRGKLLNASLAEFPEDILLVGHGASVLGTAIGLAGGAETEINASLCCLVKVVRGEGEWSIALNGDTSHLTDSEAVIRFN